MPGAGSPCGHAGAGSPCGRAQSWDGAKTEQVDKGPDQKAKPFLHSVEAAGQRQALQVPGSGAQCFSQRGVEGMCCHHSRATGCLLPHPMAWVHAIHSCPGHCGEEGSICSGDHLMLLPILLPLLFSFSKKGLMWARLILNSLCMNKPDLEFLILLTPLPECQDYRCAPTLLTFQSVSIC